MKDFAKSITNTFDNRRDFGKKIFFLGLGASFGKEAFSNQFPKSFSMLVGFTPGGPNDIVARIISPYLSSDLDSTIVVDNKPGADGELAASLIIKGNGNDLLLGSAGAFSISPAIKHTPYHPLEDFQPVAQVASSPLVMVVQGNSPYNSVHDLVQAAQQSPGKLSYSSAGFGSPTHLAAVLFCKTAGIKMLHVPYKGGAPALNDLMGGQVTAYFGGLASALPLIKAGKLKALALTGKSSVPLLPNVPNMSDLPNFADYELDNWYGVFAKKGIELGKVERIEKSIEKSLTDASLIQKFNELALVPKFRNSGSFTALVGEELKKWVAFAKTTKIE